MSDRENKKLKVHKDIAERFCRPYWSVEVNHNPKYPPEQYEMFVESEIDKNEKIKIEKIKFPCGFCKSEDVELIWLKECLTNAGGNIDFEFKCKRCGAFTFYIEDEYS